MTAVVNQYSSSQDSLVKVLEENVTRTFYRYGMTVEGENISLLLTGDEFPEGFKTKVNLRLAGKEQRFTTFCQF